MMKHTEEYKFLFLTKVLFLMSAIAFTVFCSISFYYNPLGPDGGWYSYPALSLSQGGDPADNVIPVEKIGSNAATRISGIRALFPFLTHRSLRTIYTSSWFKFFSPGIVSLKTLGLLELLILLVVFYCLLRSEVKNSSVVMLFFAFFLLDQTMILVSSSDYRPDIAVAGLSVLIFMFIKKPINLKNVLVVTTMIAISILIHVTAVIPIMFLMFYHLLRHVFTRQYHLKFISSTVLYLGISIAVIFFYDNIMNFLFSTRANGGGSLSFVMERVGKRIFQGLSFLFYKEFLRWKNYFLFSNGMTLLLVMVIGYLYARRKFDSKSFGTENDICFLSLIFTVFSIVFVDPHLTETHLIPLIPFIILFLAKEFDLNLFRSVTVRYVVVFLALGNIAMAGMTSYKTYSRGIESELNICSIQGGIRDLVVENKDGNAIWAIGPVELWPYIPKGRDIILIDRTRNIDEIKEIGKYIGKLDFVIINEEYRNYGWIESFKKEYPEAEIFRTGVIGDGESRIEIYSIRKHQEYET